jgi:phosphoenolpyruvate carboxykinase (ATP)
MDKHLVKHVDSEGEVWWGPVNFPIEPELFKLNRERARDLLNLCDPVFCIDGFAGWDPKYQIKVRIICSRPYHALFMYDMLIRPTAEELEGFGDPDYVIYNAGQFPAAHETTGLSPTTVDLSFEDREVVILGTEYAGEMKKGVFTIMNYLMPKQGVLSMHCSATADPETDRSSLLFGLSGTGKTTLSADPKRLLVGDDEHCWSDEGIFNIDSASEPCSRTSSWTTAAGSTTRMIRSRRTRAEPTRSPSSRTPRSPVWPATRRTSSFSPVTRSASCRR